jgi:membrane-bound ClpP family serine protease
MLRLLLAFIAIILSSVSLAQPGPTASAPASAPSVPADRQAQRVAVLTITGEIDRWTALSVERRLKRIEAQGFGALVVELNTPGGEVGACLAIAGALKRTSIPITTAWVNPDAYSGGAIIALACQRIVTSQAAAMGDAFAVRQTLDPRRGRTGLAALSPAERTKLLPALLGDVVESARRHGYDEFLVQAMVVDGVELWLVQDSLTGARHAINRAEYTILFGDQPDLFSEGRPLQGSPILAGVTGARYNPTPDGPRPAAGQEISESQNTAPPPTTRTPSPTSKPAPADAPSIIPPDPGTPAPLSAREAGLADADAEPLPPERKFRPASDALSDIAPAFTDPSQADSLGLATKSTRPFFSERDRGRYELVGYLTDGTNAVALRTQQLIDLGFSSQTVADDTQLAAFFGAADVTRFDMTWSERLAAFITHPIVRGLLIVVFLLGLFIEMISPGALMPIGIAALALVLLLAPPMVFGMAGWWEVAAIVGGLALVAVEVFVLPGFGLFGLLGALALFVGLVGTFIPDAGSTTGTSSDAVWGVSTVLLSMLTTGIGIFFIMKHFGSLPVFGKMVLNTRTGDAPDDDDAADPLLSAMAEPNPHRPKAGDRGVAHSPLRPSGRAEFEGRLIDVVADMGFINPGEPVRVLRAEQFRIVVERDPSPSTGGATT